MSARRNPVVRVLAVVIAIGVAVLVVVQSQNGTGATSALPASSSGTTSQADPSDSGVRIGLATLVFELEMTAPTGQSMLDAIGAGEEREGVLTPDQLAAGRALRPTKNVIDVMTMPSAGSEASVGITGAAFAGALADPTMQKISLDVDAKLNDDGSVAVEAHFWVEEADGQTRVQAEEWGLPLGKRRSASASGVIVKGEGLFMRRRFGDVEMLVLVSAQVVPPKSDG
jgi:hypothetical protein